MTNPVRPVIGNYDSLVASGELFPIDASERSSVSLRIVYWCPECKKYLATKHRADDHAFFTAHAIRRMGMKRRDWHLTNHNNDNKNNDNNKTTS